MIHVELANQQSAVAVDRQRLVELARRVVQTHGPEDVELSIAVVDDATIRRLNRQHLGHDRATDVLSFVLERDARRLEGEVVVSGETARDQADQFGWSAHDELMLYVAHGVLHLVGFDDQAAEARAEMRRQERHFLALFGLQAR